MEQDNLARDFLICECYKAGASMAECGRRYGLGRQRVQQILKKAGVWRPYSKTRRNQHLGVVVTPETKAALESEAEAKGVSVSKLTSDKLDELVGNAAPVEEAK